MWAVLPTCNRHALLVQTRLARGVSHRSAACMLSVCPLCMCAQDAKQMIETNFLSVVALTKAVVSGMMERNRGHIVNMSSIAGKEAYHGGGLYCGSKFALVSGSIPGGRPLFA